MLKMKLKKMKKTLYRLEVNDKNDNLTDMYNTIKPINKLDKSV
tara:strand:- start:7967 stop:8095 length:129 start_codon:yes stop_codon:yes gene_type:complete